MLLLYYGIFNTPYNILEILFIPEKNYFLERLILIIFISSLLFVAYFQFIDKKYKWLTNELENTNFKLKERVKELNCLYAISNLREEYLDFDELIQKIVDQLPLAWQYPEITCARIFLKDKYYISKNFNVTEWFQKSEIFLDNIFIGSIEVFYLEKRPVLDEGPFMQEERNLIKLISERIKKIVEYNEAEEALKKSELKYRHIYETALVGIFKIRVSDGKLITSNHSTLEIFGYTANEIKNSDELIKTINMNDFYFSKNHSDIIDIISKEGHVDNLDIEIKTKSGKLITILVNARIYPEEDIIEGTMIDITKLMQWFNQNISEKEAKIKSLEKSLDDIKMKDYSFGELIGKSSKMKNIFELIKNASNTEANVLITGESGTGKELIAKAVHEYSNRKNSIFVPINCGALPENLIESELFGFEAGAFTGATKRKIGKFEYSDGGTLFLDEIGELSPSLQVKLLRVLQDKIITRIGGNSEIKVDVRIIAATNREISRMINEGKFREDLFYRLNVIPIHLPPLRDRKEDIVLLTMHFINQFNILYGKNIKTISNSLYNYLTTNYWKGNVRELENIIERSVVLAKGEVLEYSNAIITDKKC